MDIKSMTLDELVINYQENLRKNLKGVDIAKIAIKLNKTPRTIENYLGKNNKKPSDLSLMLAIIENGLSLLNNKQTA